MPHLLKIQKYNNKILKIVFIGILLFAFVHSQASYTSKKDSVNKLIKTLKRNGDRCYKQNDVYNAISFYEKYNTLKTNDLKRRNRLAELYFDTRNYEKARMLFDTILVIKPKKYPKALYYKGVVSMNLHDYALASESFSAFKKKYKSARDKEGLRKMATIYIESAEWAKNQNDTNGKIVITHINEQINNKQIETSPTPVDAQTIYYSALWGDTNKNSVLVRQIFEAKKVNNHWQRTRILGTNINIPGTNTGNAALSPNGKTLYFTRSRKNWKNEDINELFISKFEDGEWLEAQKLPYPVNDENATNTQPAVGINLKTGGEILYFVSNRKGGKGGLDIWSTEYSTKTGTYSEPRVLDRNVNSPGNECSPYYDVSTRTLYFSSNGRNGMGGYDIYKSTGTQKKWTEAEHLPEPLNTSYDDYYFSILKNGAEGFFTSNRPGSFSLDNGSCCDDIFYFKYNECAKVHAKGKVYNYANYDFYDKLNDKYHLGLKYPENNKPLANIPIELYVVEKNTGSEILIEQNQTGTDGSYAFDLERSKNYKLLVKNYGYFDKRIDLSTINADCADTIDAHITQISFMPKINIRLNIYYEHNKAKLTNGAKQAIDTTLLPLFDLFPNAVIEIGSHTDSTGGDEYNMDLSQRRSESVVNYLTEKGIARERLVAMGYGETLPIAPNSMPDGSDNPDGRQLNRRTELRIVGEINSFYLDE